jgi:hypothetical protein
MDEVIVEGLEESDFLILEKILKTYKVSLADEVSFSEVHSIYNKVKQVIDYLEE